MLSEDAINRWNTTEAYEQQCMQKWRSTCTCRMQPWSKTWHTWDQYQSTEDCELGIGLWPRRSRAWCWLGRQAIYRLAFYHRWQTSCSICIVDVIFPSFPQCPSSSYQKTTLSSKSSKIGARIASKCLVMNSVFLVQSSMTWRAAFPPYL